MSYPGNTLKLSFADILFREECPSNSWQSCNFGYCTLQFIPVNTPTTTDRQISHPGAVRNPSSFQLYSAGLILSIMNILAAHDSILTSSQLPNSQNILLLSVIIFLFHSTPANHGYRTTEARSRPIQILPIGRCNANISKMYSSHWMPPRLSEWTWSVNLGVSISGEYQTIGGHSCRPSK
jgi:hypothetical protein